jgi:hypothetical protein
MLYDRTIIERRKHSLSFPGKKVIPVLLLFAISLISSGQETTTCAETLKAAQALFDKGQVEKVAAMLNDCMKKGFNREEQLVAYKLLIQTLLFEDKVREADSSMLAFLKRYPEYQLSPTDHPSFSYLFNTFRVKPVIQVALHIGTNMPFLSGVVPLTVASEPSQADYSTSFLNLFATLEARIVLHPKFELSAGGGYSQVSFTNTGDFMGFGVTTYTETQQRIDIPVCINYNIKTFGKLTPYLRAGVGAALDIHSSARVIFDPTDINNFENVEGPDINRNDSRVFANIFAQAGAGAKFKTPGGFIHLEVRSSFGFLNQRIDGGASADPLEWDYKYKDDDFRINTLSISLGYTQIFYKPSKRK